MIEQLWIEAGERLNDQAREWADQSGDGQLETRLGGRGEEPGEGVSEIAQQGPRRERVGLGRVD